ncbi:hypothetical protein WDW86_10620 [Bdellovibrionota bacterium FG-2]
MIECPSCGLKFSESGSLSETQSCPNCASALPRTPGLIDRPLAIVRSYFSQLWNICIHPSLFFRELPLKDKRGPLWGFSGPLVFALVTHWIGTALEYMWHQLVGGSIGSLFHRFSKIAEDVIEIDNPGKAAQFGAFRDQMVHWFWGTGQVIVDPFLTAASLLFTTCFVYLGARLLVSPGKNNAPSEITFESALQIVCFGMSPAIFAGLPFFGVVFFTVVLHVVLPPAKGVQNPVG